ncbi:MAG: F0F1 ATP synthase subunit B [Verrucomicrobia bacterium]|nr:F0F1 ATP synthase subunit B [Verrucomicrobiota bacterium]
MDPYFFAAGIIADTAKQFGVDWPHFISQVISFGIVAFLLHRFAYKPILQVLEERRQRIAEGLANAEKIRAELAKTEAARQEVLNQANLQANRLIEEARAAAERLREQKNQETIAQVNQILAKAKESSEAELARMKAELRREMIRLVAETTAKVTGKILTVDDQRRLAEETNRQLAA